MIQNFALIGRQAQRAARSLPRQYQAARPLSSEVTSGSQGSSKENAAQTDSKSAPTPAAPSTTPTAAAATSSVAKTRKRKQQKTASSDYWLWSADQRSEMKRALDSTKGALYEKKSLPAHTVEMAQRFATEREVDWSKLLPYEKRQQMQPTPTGSKSPMAQIIAPNFSVFDQRKQADFNPGSKVVLPLRDEAAAMPKEKRDTIEEEFGKLSSEEKFLAVANQAARAFDKASSEMGGHPLVAGGFRPPALTVVPPVVVDKAAMIVSAYDLYNFYQLTPELYEIVKKIVGPRFLPETKEFKFVSTTTGLTEAEHRNVLAHMVSETIRQAKKVAADLKAGVKLDMKTIEASDRKEITRVLEDKLAKRLAELQPLLSSTLTTRGATNVYISPQGVTKLASKPAASATPAAAAPVASATPAKPAAKSPAGAKADAKAKPAEGAKAAPAKAPAKKP